MAEVVGAKSWLRAEGLDTPELLLECNIGDNLS